MLMQLSFVELMFPIGNTLPALALDRMGRKMTMMVGCGILSFSMMMITIVSRSRRKTLSMLMLETAAQF